MLFNKLEVRQLEEGDIVNIHNVITIVRGEHNADRTRTANVIKIIDLTVPSEKSALTTNTHPEQSTIPH